MTVHDIGPFYAELAYHSAYAPHEMTIPVRQWSAGAGNGELLQRSGSLVDTDTIMGDFVDLLKAFFPASVSFDYFRIFSKPTPTSTPILVASGTLGVAGTNATAGWTKATTATFTFKTAVGNVAKIQLLDMGNNNSWDRVLFSTLGGDGLAFVNWYTGVENPFVGRDNEDVAYFEQISYDLNDALRKQYHMN